MSTQLNDKQKVVHSYNTIIHSKKKKNTCNRMEASQNHYTE